MKIAASHVGVLAVLVLALLLAPSVQAQQSSPSTEKEPSNQKFFQNDIHVKPRGGLVGAEWACGGSLCKKGKSKRLRDDLFETLAYLDVGGRNLDGMKFTLARRKGDLEISVEKKDGVFTWKTGDKRLKDAGYKACKHNDPDKTCRNSGIPGSWVDKMKQMWIRYEGDSQYQILPDKQLVHLKGR
mgnify:CR=1 FL=1